MRAIISVEEKRSQLKFMIDLNDKEKEIWDQEIVPKLPDFKESLLKHGKVLNALNYNIEQFDAMLKLQIVQGPHRVSTSFHNALIEPERMRELFNQTSLYHAGLMREEMSKMVPLEYKKAISKHLDMALELVKDDRFDKHIAVKFVNLIKAWCEEELELIELTPVDPKEKLYIHHERKALNNQSKQSTDKPTKAPSPSTNKPASNTSSSSNSTTEPLSKRAQKRKRAQERAESAEKGQSNNQSNKKSKSNPSLKH